MPSFQSSPAPAARHLTLQQRLDWLQLARTPQVGPVTFWRMINYFGSARRSLEFLPEFLRRGAGRNVEPFSREQAERELRLAGRQGAELVARGEPGYPELLARLEAPPPLLYVKGNKDLAHSPAIAIVGSRNGSAIGQKFTRNLVRDLSKSGLVIVSGLARGIDTAAHSGVVDTRTMAVIAGGIDNYYPPQNSQLQRNIEQNGLVISENPPGFTPRARDFPRRNRLISGASLATVVIEANMRSGSLITARLAGEQGREVMAVPGHPLDPRASGTNRLIMNGASMITGASDVLELLSPMTGPKPPSPPPLFAFENTKPMIETIDVTPDARQAVLDALGPNGVDIDELARATSLESREIRIILLELELADRICHDGARNIRLKTR